MAAARLRLATAALLLAATPAAALTFTDSAGRTAVVSDRVSRIFPAGPPAMAFLYTLAPDRLVGWVQRPDEAALAFVAPAYRSLPESGRLTGRRPSATPATVTAFCPDVVVDVGGVSPGYVATADIVQSASRVPYILVADRLDRTPDTYRSLGRLLGAAERAEFLAARAEAILADAHARRARRDTVVRVLVLDRPDAAPAALDGELAELVGIAAPADGAAPDRVLAGSAEAAAAARSRWPGVLVDRVPAGAFGWLGHPPGPNRLLGVGWLSRRLAGDGDEAAFVRDFHRDFYGLAMTDGEAARLLLEP